MAIVQKLGKRGKNGARSGAKPEDEVRVGSRGAGGAFRMCLASALGSFLLMLTLRLSAVTVGASA